MLLCHVGHGIQRFQGGVWNVAVVKLSFLSSPIHPTAWLWYKLTSFVWECLSDCQTWASF